MWPSKNNQWKTIIKKIKNIKDNLNEPIDKNIEKTVALLNYLGINTSSSCWGHLNRGSYAPYIDIENPQSQKLENELKKYKFESLKWKELEKKICHLNLIERKKIIFYLKKFYQKNKIDYYNQLIIHSWGRYITRIESLGASLQEILPYKKRKENLLKFQSEMKKFTRFLEDNYLKK